MILVIPAVYALDDPQMLPSPEMIEAMSAYNASLAEAGVLEVADALQPPGTGASVVFGETGVDVVGVESAGSVGGFWIIDVPSLEDAVDWAKRCPMTAGDVLEVRPMEIHEDES